jgi:2-oxoisovalerate dehydrogenase E1 component
MGLTRGAVGVAPERVLSTPICENGFTGAALGAALAGMHPIVEFMYPDFVLEATDQLFNHIAKSRYMFGGDHEVPVIVRTQISRGRGYGPQHSTDPAALFASFPGWRVASPTTPADYVGCFNAAMLCRDPVLVIDDHRLAKTTGVLPAAGFDHVTPIGKARLARAGSDVTVVSWGYGLLRVMEVVQGLAARGIEVEVIDPRWLDRASFDRASVLGSLTRTGALVIVEDARRSDSMGSQILDYILPEAFELLRTAPLRVTGQDAYSPVSKPLETHVHVQDADIESALVTAARAAAARRAQA